MKKIYYVIPLLVLFFFNSCERFDAPTIDLQMENQEDTLYKFYAVITDGGGADDFIQKGFLYSFEPDPTFLGKRTTSVELISPQNRWFFDWSVNYFWVSDTTYYVRAWAKTNAGIGYSNIISVKTKPGSIFK